MRNLIILLTLLFSIHALAINDIDRAEFKNQNALAKMNPGFESGKALWTCSPGITIDTGTQIASNSKSFAKWDSTAAGQTCYSQSVTVPTVGNCEANLLTKNASGGTHLFVAHNGTSEILSKAIDSQDGALVQRLIFPCPSSGTVKIGLKSVAPNEPSVSFDNAWVGIATGVGSGMVATPWTTFVPVTTGLGTLGGSTTQWRRNGDSMEIAGNIAAGTTSGTDATMALPNSLSANTSGWGAKARRVGTWIRDISSASSRKTGSIVIFQASPTLLYFTDDDFTTGRNPFTAIAGSTFLTSSDTISITIDSPIPIQGWVASDVVSADQQRTPRVVMYASGSGTYIPSPGVTYIEVYARGGGGGAGGGSTGGTGTAGGSTSFGSLTIGGGQPGSASDGGFPGTVSGTLPSGGSWLQPSFQQGGTGNSGAYVTGGNGGGAEYTCPGKGRAANSANGGCAGGGGGAGGGTSSSSVYGGGGGGAGGTAHFLVSAPASSYSVSIGAGGAAASPGSSVYGGSGGSGGFIRIVEHFGLTTALLANSISVGAQNGAHEYFARFACSGASGIDSASQSGATVGNISSGYCTLTFPSGMFSSQPMCSLVWEANIAVFSVVKNVSSTSIDLGCFAQSGSACSSVNGHLVCKALK